MDFIFGTITVVNDTGIKLAASVSLTFRWPSFYQRIPQETAQNSITCHHLLWENQ